MPIYVYKCFECEGEFKVKHGMTEFHEECEWCESKNIKKIPTSFLNSKIPNRITKVGDLTKDFIENSREDLKTQKKDLINKK